MKEFVIQGLRYRIRKGGPGIGWPCPETYILEQIHTAQRSRNRKAEFYDEARRLMRACTVDELLRYVAQISRAGIDEIRIILDEAKEEE
ncbi:hypothetical protein [Nitratifractor sp.]|uniref:hypothetical protein n=1 Tax=Nitratifractor sp. TaxID=2268144 RepID=UPI0025E6A7A3|nr:hypothetical protein [Nitratifractor sp.]